MEMIRGIGTLFYLTDKNSLFESFEHGTFMILFTIDSEAYSPIKACFVIYFR